MNTLDSWTEHVMTELGLEPTVLDRTAVLDVARDVAHGVARPAAPLTTYLLGVAVGSGTPPADALAKVSELATRWAGAEGHE